MTKTLALFRVFICVLFFACCLSFRSFPHNHRLERQTKTDRFLSSHDDSSSQIPSSTQSKIKSSLKWLPTVVLASALGVLGANKVQYGLAAKASGYPLYGTEDIMSKKAHGTSATAVQSILKWNCDVKTADRICNFNRNWAEYSGYFTMTSFLKDVDRTGPTTYYDSVTGKPLFIAPMGRSFEQFEEESRVHGWPSFRDNEVVWENVRCLGDGETVSVTGTHLGHNLPDRTGNRYCINLVCIAGYPTDSA